MTAAERIEALQEMIADGREAMADLRDAFPVAYTETQKVVKDAERALAREMAAARRGKRVQVLTYLRGSEWEYQAAVTFGEDGQPVAYRRLDSEAAAAAAN